MKVSACWITKNEEKNIQRSIDSVKAAVDELIVVDTGSTDNTVKISQEAGARIEHFKWINDFAAARNYALGFVNGDIIFVLDADEWFEPALTATDREEIGSVFLDNPHIQVIQHIRRNMDESGVEKSRNVESRIIRNAPGLRYYGDIHETVRYDGALPSAYFSEKWCISHSGYTGDMLAIKALRNIEILEISAKNESDPARRHMDYCYLVREYYLTNKNEEAIRNLKIVFAEPDMLRKHLLTFGNSLADLFYDMLRVASRKRDSVSRREIRRKIVDTFKNNAKTYPGAATIDLYYEFLFDPNESKLLREIGPAFDAARKIPDAPNTIYLEVEAVLSGGAAQAAFIRGQFTTAMQYAIQALKNSNIPDPMTLNTLLKCLQGQSATDIALLLNSQFNTKNPDTLKFLAEGTRMHGLRDIHAYYLDKCIKSEVATKWDCLYLLILYGKYEEAIEISKKIDAESDVETMRRAIVIASVCMGNAQAFYDNENMMGSYADILNAYFTKSALETVLPEHITILMEIYPLIAFAAGIELADELARVFSTNRMLIYMVRTQYCIKNSLFELSLSTELPNANNYFCRLFTIQAMTMLGSLEEALGLTKTVLDSGEVKPELLYYLAAISDRATGQLKTAARSLYETYMPLYNKMIDYKDIVNTGYIPDNNDKKKIKALKTLTYEQFEKRRKEYANAPHINGLGEACRNAAMIFEGRSMPASSIECLELALAYCSEQFEEIKIYEKLSGLLQKIGNAELAREILRQKGISLKN